MTLTARTKARPATAPDTVWSRRLRVGVAVASVVTTVGTAFVLGYVSPELVQAKFPDRDAAEIDTFLAVWRTVGLVFLVANAIGIAAVGGKTWIYYFVMVLDLAQGIGFLTFDRAGAGLEGLGNVASILTDGGGGIVGLVMLGFWLKYRTAWARDRAGAADG